MVESLSVVLPAYNEESIGTAVVGAVKVLQRLAARWAVIVVDDGSGDATADRVEPLIAEHPGSARLIRHRRNLGYGAAICTGFMHATGDLVFYTDSDNQFDVAGSTSCR